MRSGLVVTGIETLERNLARLLKGADRSLVIAKKASADDAADRARSLAPVGDSTELVNGIVVEHDPEYNSEVVYSEADHSIHVEYGTADQPAQPFLRPAADEERHAFFSKGKANLLSVIRRVKVG